jgi:hypothetical protein
MLTFPGSNALSRTWTVTELLSVLVEHEMDNAALQASTNARKRDRPIVIEPGKEVVKM